MENFSIPFFQKFLTKTTAGNLSNFWSAIQILISSPHYINRKILCTSCLFSGLLNTDKIVLNDLIQLLLSFNKKDALLDQIKKILIEEMLINIYFDEIANRSNVSDYFIVCNENTLKNDKNCSYEIFLISTSNNCVFSISYTSHGFSIKLTHPMPFVACYTDNLIVLLSYSQEAENLKYLNWLENKLLKKLISWSQPREHLKESVINCPSLSLINKEEYGKLYFQLKEKYGKSMCAVWPDNTDPSKYVYEDIAIATYILLIWEQDRKLRKSDKKQSFVDLGCGNGLLVHLLNSEGFPGYGLDIRKRDIWDKYPSSNILKEEPFIPTTDTFSDIDWLIGNHSDEITPWLPIAATRSSRKTNYFVIPCCPFELNGKKYQRKSSNNTVYEDFIYYVQRISEICGFDTRIDRLRIPSTKRTCLIGFNKNLTSEEYEKLCESMEIYVQKECLIESNYIVREKVEKVQNCTQINKNIQNDIVKRIVNKLLHEENLIDGWNAGSSLNVKELACVIPKDLLIQLKSECGGLQTLLKNQNIFNIRNGIVSLSRPKTVQEMKELYIVHKSNDGKITLKRKTKQNKTNRNKHIKLDNTEFDKLLQKKDCWYFTNHPQGCPLSSKDCSFKHAN